MRSRTRWMVCIAAVVLAVPAGAGATSPHATDVAGDANGIMTPVWNGGLIGWLIETATQDRDPLGNGTPGPVSEDQADLRSLTFATDYVAVPVGDDGIDYRATAFMVHMTTTAPPTGDPALGFAVKVFLVPLEGEVCRAGLYGHVGDWTTAPDGSARYVGEVDAWGSQCPPNRDVPDPRWTTQVDPARSEITIRFPFDSLTGGERRVLGEQALVYGARAYTASSLHQLDATETAEAFEIGSDVPPDVPCTRGCP